MDLTNWDKSKQLHDNVKLYQLKPRKYFHPVHELQQDLHFQCQHDVKSEFQDIIT